MIGNEFSKLIMSSDAELWIVKFVKALRIKDYGHCSPQALISHFAPSVLQAA